MMHTIKQLFFISMFMAVFGLDQSIAQTPNLKIISLSSTEYKKNSSQAIYPAFVDGIAYQSWTEEGPKAYYQLMAEGGTKPYSWQIVKGQLPAGLRLSKDGKISGLPSREGNFKFSIKAIDSKGSSVTKELVLQAAPYRSKWLADAKFGIMVQWGAYTDPPLYSKAELPNFEKRITKFNADQWADAVVNMGGKVLNYTVKAGDGTRHWPSTTPSKLELKTKRNIVAELIAACHKRGLKFVAYFAPDNTWNKQLNDVGSDGTWGTLNKGLIKELVLMGVDGFWIDVTSSTELYKGMDPKWFPWKEILPIMRANNPYIVCANNPGLEFGGTVLRYPDTDVVLYEGGMSPSESALKVAKPISVKKKIALEVDNMLDNTWSWRVDPKLRQPKPAEMIIKNIQANWAVGATYMLNYPVSTDGNIMPAEYKPLLAKIGAFVKANQGWSVTPVASLADTLSYNQLQTLTLTAKPGARIYYTTDGSEPTIKSKLYKTPLKLSRTTRINAISVEKGKPASKKLDKIFNISADLSATGTRKASTSMVPKSTETAKVEPEDYYRGMKITVGANAITLHEVGRKHVEGNSNPHSIIIKRFADDYPILTAVINPGKKVEEDGYKYVTIPPTKLEAGKSYIIASKEDKNDKFIPQEFAAPINNKDFRIVSHFILSPVGDRSPIKDDKIGSILGLKYDLTTEVTKNLALGKTAFLKDNDGYSMIPGRNVLYAENGIDGDLSTMAQAGGKYPWTLSVDLNQVVDNVTTVIVHFGEQNFATEFVILSSLDGKVWNKIGGKSSNSDINCTIQFKPVQARYFQVKALKPDAKGQKGNQMGILEFEIYN